MYFTATGVKRIIHYIKHFLIWRFYSIHEDDRKDTKRGLCLYQIPPFVLEKIKSTSKGDFSLAYRHVVTENNRHDNAVNGNSFTKDYTANLKKQRRN